MNLVDRIRAHAVFRVWAISLAIWLEWWSLRLVCSVARMRFGISEIYFFFGYFSFGLAINLILASAFALACIVFKVGRRKSIFCLAVTLNFFACLMLSTKVVHAYERWALAGVAARAKPLVVAIESYAMDHGAPPRSLQELVPRYLQAIPATGGFPHEFGYYSEHESNRPLYGNSWKLEIELPAVIPFEGDWFTYLPNQNYSEPEASSQDQRIGDWRYHTSIYD